MTNNGTSAIKYSEAIVAALLTAFCVLIFIYGINMMQHQPIGYDEGYNATVAANFARYGEYRVSYPEPITFYQMITTGTPVILPTGLLYMLFGINGVTSAIVPLFYCVGTIIVLFLLLRRCFTTCPHGNAIALVLVCVSILSEKTLQYVSTHLIGGVACAFFLLLSALLLSYGYSSGKNRYFMLSGSFVMASFLTKSSTVFFLVALIGLIVIETVLKRISIRNMLFFVAGLIISLLIIDSYKIFQLGGLNEWLRWWGAEWQNMLSQSGELAAKPSFGEKFAYLSKVFGASKYVAACLVVLPTIAFVSFTLLQHNGKARHINDASRCVILLGVAASSLEVYFVLFGGEGLVYARRHFVNEYLVKITALLLIGQISSWIIGTRGIKLWKAVPVAIVALVALFLSFPLQTVIEVTKDYIDKQTSDDYELVLMGDFLRDVDSLGTDASLYCYGWWQEPNVTLFLNDRKMNDIGSMDTARLNSEESYLIIGRRFDHANLDDIRNAWHVSLTKVNSIDVDYNRLPPYNSYDLFSIYKIESTE